MKIGFDRSFKIQGCEIVNYLLEKSRIVFQSTNERNYHIFYQIIAGADAGMKQRLYLRPAGEYYYLNQSGCLRIEGVDDAQEFKDVMEAMATLQFSSSTVESIFKGLAGILQLGNIKFEPHTSSDNCKIAASSEDAVRMCSELFGIDLALLRYALVEKKMQMSRRGSVVSIALSVTQAEDSRDTIAKSLYANLFDWVIQRVNATLRTEEPPFSIGILDIFGFEVFDLNSFEQLCINYANEKLQYHFNDVIFSVERMMYEEEGISLDAVNFEDNGECVNLIEGKPFGLISLLEEECNLGNNGSDLSYINKLEKNFGVGKPAVNKYFIKNKTKPDCFSVAHFAGAVEYNVTGFLDKNRDTLSNTCRETMLSSQIPLISELFVEKAEASSASSTASAGGGGGKNNQKQNTKSTLGGQFRNQLVGLMLNLKVTEPHFIRCVKPNHAKVPNVIDGSLALRQMRYAGLFEAIRIRKSGYAYRVTFSAFANTYQILVDGLMKKRKEGKITDRDAAWLILQQCTAQNLLDRAVWQVGQSSRVFLKNTSDRSVLERIRTQRIMVFVLRLQCAARAFLRRLASQKEQREALAEQRKLDERQRKMQLAIVRIQKHWRRKLVQLSFRSMNNLVELRRVLARREIHKIRDLLQRIEQDFVNIPHILLQQQQQQQQARQRGGEASSSPNKATAAAVTPGKSAMKAGTTTTSSAAAIAMGTVPTASTVAATPRDPRAVMFEMFEHEIKVARVMLKLIEVQDTLVDDLHRAMEGSNVTDLNRLILKAERFEMNNHPLVIEAKEMLVQLFSKRRVMKTLLTFLQNEDEFHESILQTIEEARSLDIDAGFLEKVIAVYDNAGPRLKTRNRLRQAIETINRFQVEQGVLEVLEIRKHHPQFAESELRAARMLLRMLHFDQLLYPHLASNQYVFNTKRSESTEMVDASELDEHPAAESEPLTVSSPSTATTLWGEPILAEPCPSKLTPEIMEVCNAISEASSNPAIAKLHKQRLQQLLTVRGASEEVFAAIRYYKWSRTVCTWKYPEITGASSAAGSDVTAQQQGMKDATSALQTSINSPLARSKKEGIFQSVEDTKRQQVHLKQQHQSLQRSVRGGAGNAEWKDDSSSGVYPNGSNGGSAGDDEEFFGLRFRDARSNVHIIRSLHQDFDVSLYQTSSALMEAAVSSVSNTNSIHDTLRHLDKMSSIDMDITLPNGMVFNKTVIRRPGMPTSTSAVQSSLEAQIQLHGDTVRAPGGSGSKGKPGATQRPGMNSSKGTAALSNSRRVISTAWTTTVEDSFARSQVLSLLLL